MRYVVLGAGAVGGVVGAHLAMTGTPTTLVARGAHLAAIRESGLVLDGPDGRHTVRAPATDRLADVEWSADTVVLLAVKSQQTAAALADLRDHAPYDVGVVCLQNGVRNEAEALRLFPRVQGITVMLPATHLEPGVVVQRSAGKPGILDVGRYPSGVDELSEAVSRDLRGAGFASVPRPDIMAWKHRKLLLNLGNGVDAAYGPGEAADELERRCREEGETVLAAARIDVTGAEADAERRGDLLRRRDDVDPAGGSTWQSVTRGLDVEIDALTGEIVLQGRLHDVATPACALVQRDVHDLVRRGAAARSLDAAEALRRLDRHAG